MPLNLNALGLGELEVKSSFGEVFIAEIEIYGLDPEDPDLKDFYNVYIEPVYDSLPGIQEYVKGLSVNISVKDGKPKLLITHEDYFSEPFIEFSIFISTGQINYTRSFSALIDFPQTVIAKSQVEPPPTVAEQPVAPAVEPDVSPLPDTEYLWQDPSGGRIVRPGDTLFTIAQGVQRQYGGNINQIMDAIFATNPEAFINNDRNLIKAGAVLDISEDTATQIITVEPEEELVASSEQYGPVQAGDTLYQISRRYQEQYDLSVPELAEQIFSINKHAFIRDDINLLRQGVILDLPQGKEEETEDTVIKSEIRDEQYLEILVPPEETGGIELQNETAQVQQKLEESMVDLEEVVRENTELKNSIEQSAKQIESMQQNLDTSAAQIEALQAQIDELKQQKPEEIQTKAEVTPVVETQVSPPVKDKESSEEGTVQSVIDNLIAQFQAHPWTVIIIVIIIAISIVLLFIFLTRIQAGEQGEEAIERVYEFRDRVPDNELKARIKHKLSEREKKLREVEQLEEDDEDPDTGITEDDYIDFDDGR